MTDGAFGTPHPIEEGKTLTTTRVPEAIGTEPPQKPDVVAEALTSALRDLLWSEAPYGDPCLPTNEFSLLYEEDYSVEDRATPRETAILCTPDGRYWHATIAVTVVEQTVRTPVEDGDDEDGDA